MNNRFIKHSVVLGLAVMVAHSAMAAGGRSDYDLDNDGLIEINDLADLAEINNNLKGASLYASSAGCPTAGCKGFELTVDLNFDTNADGKLDAKDAYWNSGQGWLAVGSYSNSKPFTAVFDGNGHIIRNLMINRPNDSNQGLFGYSEGATLRNLGLSGSATSVTGYRSVGLLIGGLVQGSVQGCFSTGMVAGDSAGGLVGKASNSSIQMAFSTARVNGVYWAGGLVGYADNTITITASYAVGKVRVTQRDRTAGGLVGNVTPVKDSYWSIEAVGQPNTVGQGLSLAQLKCPTAADNTTCVPSSTLYRGWGALNPQTNQPYWDFGTNTQLPALVFNGIAYRDNDADGVVDSDDKFPNNPAVALDSDNDGLPDRWTGLCDQQCQTSSGLQLDQLPNSAAASIDADFDGRPDSWNASCDVACQTASGLTLDARLNDFDNDGIVDSLDTDLNNDGTVDADADHNGLVEVRSWAQLDAMRFNLSGSGRTLTARGSTDVSGCGSRLVQGARERGCFGYELMLDLNFDTNNDGKLDDKDAYWNSGQGWLAIGDSSAPFSAVFEGNGHLIRNLMINRPNSNYQGLFGFVGATGEIRRIGLAGKMTSIVGQDYVGGLVGWLAGSVHSSFTTGRVVGRDRVGGVVGEASDPITAVGSITVAFSTASVTGNVFVGGLVAISYSSVIASYATGAVYSKNRQAYGLGDIQKPIASYWINEALEEPNQTRAEGIAVSLAQLQCPTTANNSNCISGQVLFPNWSDYKDASGNALWSFGSSSQLPALVLNGQSYRDGDGDGYLDEDDLYPNNTAAAFDSDADGAPDQWSLICNTACQQSSGLVLDQFPNNAVAAVDRDLDGLPDVWNAACNAACQLASGLTLDKSPNDVDNDGITDSADADANNDGKTDVDADHNGLIDISSLTQLDAMRYSLAGWGRKMSATDSLDVSGCPALVVQGKLQRQCWGYELKADLDFDSNKDGKLDANDQFWNAGLGWEPVGGGDDFTASFNGNGHLIRNLMINRPEDYQGLFGQTLGAQIRDLGIVSASVTAERNVGILAGFARLSSIQGCFTTGSATGEGDVGGLIGDSSSRVQAVFSTASVSNTPSAGGDIGGLLGAGSLNGGYALGKVTGARFPGGLVGSWGEVVNSYWATDSTGQTNSNGGGLGATLAQLQCPTAADNSTCVAGKVLYEGWANHKDAKGTAYWQFTGTQVPGLVLNGVVYRDSDADGVLDHEDNDNDNDGILDSVDAFMFNPAASKDSDGDGFPDSWNAGCDSACQTASGLKLDAVPNNKAASVDSDGDGAPDSWNAGCDASCQSASGLKLDAFPNNKAASVDSDADGLPDSWNAGCNTACQLASGLTLDSKPVQIFWHHKDGTNYLFEFQASKLQKDYQLNQIPASWNVTGSGDLNGDGSTDLVWRNQLTGEVYLYLMKDGQIQQQASLVTLDDLSWQIAAVADFNGDHKADLLWRNKFSGELSVWLMNGLSKSQERVLPKVADLNWQLAGAGDLNGDGTADLVWRNKQTGENYLFLMQNGLVLADIPLFRVADTAWQVAALGDFNADGKTDMYWRNNQTGENYVILMNGSQVIGERDAVKVADLNWQVVANADFDGDAKADLLWRHKTTGENHLFLLDGLNLKADYPLPQVKDLNWQVGAVLTQD